MEYGNIIKKGQFAPSINTVSSAAQTTRDNDNSYMIKKLRDRGISFGPGLSDEEINKIEEIYDISFPASLLKFYCTVMPIGERFPNWRDFSEKNIRELKERMFLPYKWLSGDILESKSFRNAKEVPKLIPIYSHRYMPVIDHPDPPVFSTVGIDTIWYGKDLREYLYNEFINEQVMVSDGIAYIPLWSEVIEQNSLK